MSEMAMQSSNDVDPKTGLSEEEATFTTLTSVVMDSVLDFENELTSADELELDIMVKLCPPKDAYTDMLSELDIMNEFAISNESAYDIPVDPIIANEPPMDIIDQVAVAHEPPPDAKTDNKDPLAPTITDPTTLQENLNKDRPTRFRLQHFCEICLMGFTRIGSLADHLREDHQIAHPFACDTCGSKFRSPLNLGRHKRIHEAKEKYHCAQCTYSTTQRSNLVSHQRIHEKNYTHRCEDCGAGFMQRTKFLEHKLTHEASKSANVCKVCKKSFNYKRNLVAHMKSQHPEVSNNPVVKMYPCDYCPDKFTSQRRLKKHLSSCHKNERRKFPCEICSKVLCSKWVLQDHMRTHRGEKAARCEDCGKSFAKMANLKVHRRIHTGERPYVCTICGRGFTQRTALVHHTRAHTGDRPYTCDECGKGFVAGTLLRKHVLNHERMAAKKAGVDKLK